MKFPISRHHRARRTQFRITHLYRTKPVVKDFRWETFAKILAAILTIGGLALHLMGYLSFRTNLDTWGVDPGLFPHSTEATIINGYYVFLETTVAIYMSVNKKFAILFTIGMTLLLFILLNLNNNKLGSTAFTRFQHWQPKWLTNLAASVFISSIVVGLVPAAILIVVVSLMVPAVLGEKSGRALAEKQKIKFSAGCNQKDLTEKCIEIRRDGKPISYGFLIEGSESHIAIFDVDKKTAIAFERDSTELLVDPKRCTPLKLHTCP